MLLQMGYAMEMLGILAALAVCLLVLHVFTKRSKRFKPGEWDIPKDFRRRPKPSPTRQPDELDRACYHDRGLADRLTQHERERSPGISQQEARRRALERLYRDRAS